MEFQGQEIKKKRWKGGRKERKGQVRLKVKEEDEAKDENILKVLRNTGGEGRKRRKGKRKRKLGKVQK